MTKKIIIGQPHLENAEFFLKVNGIKCFVWIDGHRHVKYNSPDFVRVKYGTYEAAAKTLDLVEKVVIDMFDKKVFRKCNAGSKKDGTKNKNNGI